MLKKIPLAIALSLLWGGVPNAAAAPLESASDDALSELSGEHDLNAIVVRASGIVDDVPATVSIITNQQIQEAGARNIKDVLRDEVDVSVRTRPGTFSITGSSTGRARNESINIRGVEGNRVLIVQDGIRLPNGFSFGPAFQSGRGDFWDVDSFRKIEILRGAASTQYGADSLAGVVSATTLDVGDILKPGKPYGGFVQGGYAAVDNSFNNAAGVAFDNGRWDGMFMTSLRNGHEVISQENDKRPNAWRTAPNPVNYDSRYFIGKLGLRTDRDNRFQLTLEDLKLQVDTKLYSEVFPYRLVRETREMFSNDTTKKRRLSIEHFYQSENDPWVQRMHHHLYWQDAGVRQFTSHDIFRPDPARPDPSRDWIFDYSGFYGGPKGISHRTRDNTYRETTLGWSSVFESAVKTAHMEHRLRYGLDLSRAKVGSLLDGTVPFFGQLFPSKVSPDTRYSLAGLFVQDEIVINTLHVIPGLRFDYYQIAPTEKLLSTYDKFLLAYKDNPAAIASFGPNFTAKDRTDGEVAKLSGRALTPRLGLIWNADPAFAPYFNYAKGFRAPTPDQVNVNHNNMTFRYTVVGNPALRPERVTGMELGVRGKIDGFRYAVSAFDSRYTDFMAQRPVAFDLERYNYLTFQTINLSKAHVRGVEARTEWDLNSQWRLNAAIGRTLGDALIRQAIENPDLTISYGNAQWQPLDSVHPMKALLGVKYKTTEWGAHANLEHSWGKSGNSVSAPSDGSKRVLTSGFSIVDVGLYWKPIADMTVTLNVNNLFNVYYERWSDVGSLEYVDYKQTNQTRRHYTASGRNGQFSVRYVF